MNNINNNDTSEMKTNLRKNELAVTGEILEIVELATQHDNKIVSHNKSGGRHTEIK